MRSVQASGAARLDHEAHAGLGCLQKQSTALGMAGSGRDGMAPCFGKVKEVAMAASMVSAQESESRRKIHIYIPGRGRAGMVAAALLRLLLLFLKDTVVATRC